MQVAANAENDYKSVAANPTTSSKLQSSATRNWIPSKTNQTWNSVSAIKIKRHHKFTMGKEFIFGYPLSSNVKPTTKWLPQTYWQFDTWQFVIVPFVLNKTCEYRVQRRKKPHARLWVVGLIGGWWSGTYEKRGNIANYLGPTFGTAFVLIRPFINTFTHSFILVLYGQQLDLGDLVTISQS